MKQQWFAFRAYNTTTQYGYGTAKEAEAYATWLNRDRNINVYGVYPLAKEEAHDLGLDGGHHDGFSLDDCELN